MSQTKTSHLRPGLLLVGGVLAWIGILFTILMVAENASAPDQPPTQIAHQPTLSASTVTPAPPTVTPSPTPTITPSATATFTFTQTLPSTGTASTPTTETASTPQSAACPPPQGWEAYRVQQGDTLFAFVLGADNTVTVEEIMAANCLNSRMLQLDQVLYLPPGAAENAPSSDPAPGAASLGATGPRTPNCPCTISVPAGWRREQIAEAINASQTAFTGADYLNVTGPGASAPFDFVMNRPAGTSMEGFLFPSTYTIQNDTTAEGFRDMQLAAFAANVSPQMQADAAAQGVTFYQALIIASIVQRESHAPETQKLVASVYYNRFRDGNRLASTIPVQYALGGPGNWWPRITNSNVEVESPYNTYTKAGLPPTPVDNPGPTAIFAAVYPAQTNYYYHTAACDGSGEAFAETYEEHLANANCD